MNRVKGSSIKNLPNFVKQEFGNEGYEKWINSLFGDIQDIYKSDILSSNWYPLDAYMEGEKKICELFFEGNQTKASKIGKFIATNNLTGIYKFFVKIGSPAFLLKRAKAVASTFFENIKIEVEIISNNNVKLIILEFDDVEEIFDYHYTGWVKKAFEISGCKNVEVIINSSLAKGDKQSEYELTWD